MTFLVLLLQNNPRDRENIRATIAGGGDPISSKERPDVVYTSFEQAEQAAINLAKTNPQKQYAVMAVSKVYETTNPTVLTKIFNEAGELVLDKQ